MNILKTLDLIAETMILLVPLAVLFCFPVSGVMLMMYLEERFYIIKELQGLQLLAITIHGIVVFTVWFYFVGGFN